MNLLQNSMNIDRESLLSSLTFLPDTTFTLLARRFIISLSFGHDYDKIKGEIATTEDKNLRKWKDARKSVSGELQYRVDTIIRSETMCNCCISTPPT